MFALSKKMRDNSEVESMRNGKSVSSLGASGEPRLDSVPIKKDGETRSNLNSVRFGRPPRSEGIWLLTIAVSFLVLIVTDFRDSTSITLTMAILLNTVVRITFPSSYVPARQTQEGFLYGPIFARILATMAEFTFYYTEGLACDGWRVIICLTIVGEIFCWAHLLLQSELFGFIEDCVWACVHAYAVFCSYSSNPTFAIGLGVPYLSYVLFLHLPDTFRRVLAKPLHSPFRISYGPLDSHSMKWITISMIYQPFCYAAFVYCIDYPF